MKNLLKVIGAVFLLVAMMAGTVVMTLWYVAYRERRDSQDGESRASATDTRSLHVTPQEHEAVSSPDGDLKWSQNEILALRREVGNQTVIALLELLRERGGGVVNYRELMDRTGRTMPQVRADMASFSRSVKKIEGHESWPIDTTDPTDAESGIAYTAPKSYLDWWFEE